MRPAFLLAAGAVSGFFGARTYGHAQSRPIKERQYSTIMDDGVAAQPVTGHLADTETIKAELADLRDTYDRLMSDKLTEAKTNGKKLIVVIGDNYIKKESLLVQLVIINVTLKYGIQHLGVELNDELLSKLKNTPCSELHTNYPNIVYLISFAKSKALKVIPIDPDCFQPDETRVANMKAALRQLDDHAIVVIAANHLYEFFSDQELKQQFEIFTINSSNITNAEIRKLGHVSPYHAALANLACNPLVAFQCDIKADISCMPGSELISLANDIDKYKHECNTTFKMKG
jgi:hypothetical protein